MQLTNFSLEVASERRTRTDVGWDARYIRKVALVGCCCCDGDCSAVRVNCCAATDVLAASCKLRLFYSPNQL